MKVLSTILFLAAASVAVGSASADEGFKLRGLGNFGIAPAPSMLLADPPREAVRTKPLESVIEAIRLRLPGRALGARLVEWRGREAYKIRWMGENGKVHDITADARSGAILDER